MEDKACTNLNKNVRFLAYAILLTKEIVLVNPFFIIVRAAREFIQDEIREVSGLAVVRGTVIVDEYEKSYKPLQIAQEVKNPGSLIEYYIALRAFERFQTLYGHIPGEYHVETDTTKLCVVASKILSEWGIMEILSEDLVHEICRYGTDIHSVSAFTGGCAEK